MDIRWGLNWFGVFFDGWELLVLLGYLGERGYLSGLRIILLWGGILLKGIIRIGLVICEVGYRYEGVSEIEEYNGAGSDTGYAQG